MSEQIINQIISIIIYSESKWGSIIFCFQKFSWQYLSLSDYTILIIVPTFVTVDPFKPRFADTFTLARLSFLAQSSISAAHLAKICQYRIELTNTVLLHSDDVMNLLFHGM